MAKSTGALVPVDHIAQSIRVLRGHKVLFDAELTAEEFANLKSHFATSSWGGRRKRPIAFTEHGAIMAATVLNSPRAVEMTVYVVRAFVKLRELLASNKDLARKLATLERSLVALDLKAQRRFKEVYDAIRALMAAPAPSEPRREFRSTPCVSHALSA
jgi:hypothetical protein